MITVSNTSVSDVNKTLDMVRKDLENTVIKDTNNKYNTGATKNVLTSPISSTKPLNTYNSPSYKQHHQSVASTQSPFSKLRGVNKTPPIQSPHAINKLNKINESNTNNNNNVNNNNSNTNNLSPQYIKKMKRRKSVEDNKVIVANRFRLLKKLGKGSFGIAYKSLDLITNEEIALKLERQRENSSNREIQILEKLGDSDRVPKLLWYGNFRQYKAMAIELQGPNLCTLFDLNHKQFSLKSVTHIITEILHCMESIHSFGIVHRDIKPQNFIIGLKDPTKIFVIDFGLSSTFLEYQSDNNNSNVKHVKYQDSVSPVGTARYASLNNHRGIRQTRRDDLESVAYMIIYFLKGELPWQGMKQNDRVKKWKNIEKKKASISIHELCNNLPHEFVYFLDYCKKLKYNSKPEYSTLIKVFRKLYINSGFKDDYLFDWTTVDED